MPIAVPPQTAVFGPCNVAAIFDVNCRPSQTGGFLPKVWLGNFSDFESNLEIQNYTGPDCNIGQVIAGVINPLQLTLGGFYEFDTVPNSVGYTMSGYGPAGQAAAGGDQTLTFAIYGQDPARLRLIEQLILGRVVAIVRQRGFSNYYGGPVQDELNTIVLGYPNGLEANFELNWGQAPADEPKTTFTFTGGHFNPGFILRPDPTVYTSNTPIREFLEQVTASCP